MVVAIVPLAVLVIGALMWGFAPSRLSDAGRIAYAIGLFWLVAAYAHATVHIG